MTTTATRTPIVHTGGAATSAASGPLEAGISERPVRELRFGVGLRREHFDHVLAHLDDVDFLEILPENFMRFGGRPGRILREVAARVPTTSHGVSLSLGGPDPLDTTYLGELRELFQWLDPPWFSDHLSYSSAFGVEYHDLLPLPFTEEAVAHVAERIRFAQDFIGRPILVENPSYYMHYPSSEMTEAEFVAAVVERADCFLLLDVNNVFVNAENHGYDAREFIAAMPAERVLQYHMAGHVDGDGFLVDTHSAPVRPEVLELYRFTLETVGPAWTLLEWDHAIPSLDGLLRELDTLREVAGRARVAPAARRGEVALSRPPMAAPPEVARAPGEAIL